MQVAENTSQARYASVGLVGKDGVEYQRFVIMQQIGKGIIPDNIQEAFPDPNFRAYVLNNFDTNGDGKISGAEAATVTRIQLSNDEIKSLDGIGLFLNLNELSFSSNQLTSLDLSYNTKLTNLDVNECPALTLLYCYNNQPTSLDLSNNTALFYLECYSNQLTTLDVSKTNLGNSYYYRYSLYCAPMETLQKLFLKKAGILTVSHSGATHIISPTRQK